MGGRFWPAVHQWFLDRHGLAAELPSGASLPARSRFGSFRLRLMGRPTSMARKRKPLVVNRETVKLDARGLQITQRPNGGFTNIGSPPKKHALAGICLALSGYIATLQL
jgi:hypothetical protein